MSILFLITGGTIDNLDRDKAGYSPLGHESLIPDLLKQARITADYRTEVVMQKDSRDLDNKDRANLLDICTKAKEEKIVITHGTFSIPETAKYLGPIAPSNKTIVLCGSLIPANEKQSDALFNLGFAFRAAQDLAPGVYVAMHGCIFSWNNVKKENGIIQKEQL